MDAIRTYAAFKPTVADCGWTAPAAINSTITTTTIDARTLTASFPFLAQASFEKENADRTETLSSAPYAISSNCGSR
jgi:hypothetical protein